MNVDGRSYNIQLWDTAGQEVFRSTTATYFRNRHVMLFCYDITKKDSFTHIDEWIKEFEQVQRETNKTIKFLVGCKKDQNSNRQVSPNEGKSFAKRNNMIHFECSALNGEGVTDIFTAAIAELQKAGGIVDLDPTAGASDFRSGRQNRAAQKKDVQQTQQSQPLQKSTEEPITLQQPQNQAEEEEGEGACC